jgi:hypothetical protein
MFSGLSLSKFIGSAALAFERETLAQRRQVKGFPYTIFYLNEPDMIVILAIAHISRRPGYGNKRIAVD